MDFIKDYAHEPVNFIAGTFDIAKDPAPVAKGVEIAERQPVKLVNGNVEPVEAADISGTEVAGLYGIAAAEASGNTVPIYLTGEFFADGLVLPTGVSPEDLKVAFREIGIFLK